MTTHVSFIFLVILGQCFGMLPVSNIRNHKVSALNFHCKSLKVFYSVMYMFLLFLNFTIVVIDMALNTASFDYFGKSLLRCKL